MIACNELGHALQHAHMQTPQIQITIIDHSLHIASQHLLVCVHVFMSYIRMMACDSDITATCVCVLI